MVKGLYLTLKTGLMKPTSVPREVIDALDSIQVHTTAGETASGFELKFNLGKRSPLNTLLLQMGGDSVSSLIRVVIIITVNGRSEMLMDGVMTHHDINPGSGSNPPIRRAFSRCSPIHSCRRSSEAPSSSIFRPSSARRFLPRFFPTR